MTIDPDIMEQAQKVAETVLRNLARAVLEAAAKAGG